MVLAAQLARQIVSAASWAASAASGPDHPYLLTGPDALLADDSGLVAVFVEHAIEIARPKALATRQILSTLALPSHARFVLVTRDERSSNNRDWNWDLVVGAGRPRYIADALRSVERRRSETPSEVRQDAFAAATPDGLEEKTQRGVVPGDRYRRASLRSRSVVADAYGLQASAETRSSSEATKRLIAAFQVSVPLDYELDFGAAYPVAGGPGLHRFRLQARLESMRVFDPFKLVRAAAFAGWTLTDVPAEESLFEGLVAETTLYDYE